MQKIRGRRREDENKNFDKFDAVTNDPVSQ